MESNVEQYNEFIKVTRRHQAEREKIKRLELKRNPPIDEYFIDLSQVDTLTEANLSEVPNKGDNFSKAQERDRKLSELYGSQESFEVIRSMEMHLDDQFKSKCRLLKPHYWPVIPIIPKPYLNEKRA